MQGRFALPRQISVGASASASWPEVLAGLVSEDGPGEPAISSEEGSTGLKKSIGTGAAKHAQGGLRRKSSIKSSSLGVMKAEELWELSKEMSMTISLNLTSPEPNKMHM